LIPLEKGKTGEEAPAFVVEIAYLDRIAALTEKGKARLTFFAVDMPISKSTAILHYSPQYRFTPMPGNFRSTAYASPTAAVLRSGSSDAEGVSVPSALAPNALVSRLHETRGTSRPARITPPRVGFPHLGPSIFLVSELTSENQSPIVELEYQRDKKRGER
jgi:hypothetical protein